MMLTSDGNPSKRPREQPLSSRRSDRIVLDVGGTCFITSVSTLTANSSYFRSKFSDEWWGETNDNTVFIDQEPEPFAVLLSYMRVGYVECQSINKKVLALAEFLGVDRLLYAVKCRALRNKKPDFNSSDDEASLAFDLEYGGILPAIASGILPLYLMKKNTALKEFTSLYFRLPEGGTQIEACVSAPETSFSNRPVGEPSHYVDRVPNCCTVLDALNWLSRNGFTTEEKSLQALCDAEVKGIVNYLVLGQLIFSRKRTNFIKDSSFINNIIIGKDTFESDKNDQQKEFAMITIRAGEVVVEADQGILRDIEVNGTTEATRIVEVEGITTVEGGMNWLHRGGYIEREGRLEHFYRDVIRNFQHQNEDEDVEMLEFMIFSRPLSSSRTESISNANEVPVEQDNAH